MLAAKQPSERPWRVTPLRRGISSGVMQPGQEIGSLPPRSSPKESPTMSDKMSRRFFFLGSLGAQLSSLFIRKRGQAASPTPSPVHRPDDPCKPTCCHLDDGKVHSTTLDTYDAEGELISIQELPPGSKVV